MSKRKTIKVFFTEKELESIDNICEELVLKRATYLNQTLVNEFKVLEEKDPTGIFIEFIRENIDDVVFKELLFYPTIETYNTVRKYAKLTKLNMGQVVRCLALPHINYLTEKECDE